MKNHHASHIALVKALLFNPKVLIFFLFLHKNMCWGINPFMPSWLSYLNFLDRSISNRRDGMSG